MGQGIQQPPVQQSGGSSLLDVLKVLYEPSAVFERVREKPSFLVPYLVICVVQVAIYFVNMPFLRAGMAAQFAARPAGGPDPSKFLWIGAVFIPVGFAIGLLIGGRLLSVTAYSAVPAVVLLTIVGAAVLQLKGVGQITSPQDMQPALGLDLLAPGATGFVGAALRAINPFTIWGLVLTAIGVSTTHRLSKQTGYIVATVSFL